MFSRRVPLSASLSAKQQVPPYSKVEVTIEPLSSMFWTPWTWWGRRPSSVRPHEREASRREPIQLRNPSRINPCSVLPCRSPWWKYSKILLNYSFTLTASWLSIVPLGLPVVPEVYARMQHWEDHPIICVLCSNGIVGNWKTKNEILLVRSCIFKPWYSNEIIANALFTNAIWYDQNLYDLEV